MTIDLDALGASLARLETIAGEPVAVADQMQHVVSAAHEMFAVTGTGLMLIDEGQVLRYVASSDEPGMALEQAQEQVGVGPCVDSLVLDEIVSTSDVQSDPRWPSLHRHLSGIPVHAVLGVPVHLSGGAVGCLDVYMSHETEWSASQVNALDRYARMVEHILVLNITVNRNDTLVQQLQHALDYRVVIERAVGYLMGRAGMDAVSAFNTLRTAARNSRRKVVEVAAELLDGRELPSG